MAGDIQGPTNSGGVTAMPIAGRTAHMLERMHGMTPEERAWRHQFLKDQELMPDEPRNVPELRKELYNPIRRFYQAPLNVLCDKLVPVVGGLNAVILRSFIPKLFFGIVGIYLITYHLKYNQRDWTTYSGWTFRASKVKSIPGDPDFPRLTERHHPSDYADCGFKSRTVFLD